MEDLIRVGIVSSINYEKGMAKVTYPDRDNEVTDNFPYLCYGEEYYMPAVGDHVLVAHLSTGEHEGVIVGKFWNGDRRSKKVGANVFHKELPAGTDRTFISFEDGTLTIQADKIVIKAGENTIRVKNNEIILDGKVEVKKEMEVKQTISAKDFIKTS